MEVSDTDTPVTSGQMDEPQSYYVHTGEEENSISARNLNPVVYRSQSRLLSSNLMQNAAGADKN
jgi:hypothetical protein